MLCFLTNWCLMISYCFWNSCILWKFTILRHSWIYPVFKVRSFSSTGATWLPTVDCFPLYSEMSLTAPSTKVSSSLKFRDFINRCFYKVDPSLNSGTSLTGAGSSPLLFEIDGFTPTSIMRSWAFLCSVWTRVLVVPTTWILVKLFLHLVLQKQHDVDLEQVQDFHKQLSLNGSGVFSISKLGVSATKFLTPSVGVVLEGCLKV